VQNFNYFVTQQPKEPLYHYTSLDGLMGIVESGYMWASNPLYLNDSTELLLAQSQMMESIKVKLNSSSVAQVDKTILDQFHYWLSLGNINMKSLFVSSFSEKGNVLSQWRGYTPKNKGISFCFSPFDIFTLASSQNYRLLKCVYDETDQKKIVEDAIEAILIYCRECGVNPNLHPSQSYFTCLENCSELILTASVLIKHKAFSEECEWRLVSQMTSILQDPTVKYRVGDSALIPYRAFSIAQKDGKIRFSSLYVGPTSSMNLSQASISNFLGTNKVVLTNGILNCQIPYISS